MMNQQNIIKQAVELLQAGEVVAIPTETVYGLAADASNEVAVSKIFELKGRPADHPVIVHIADASKLTDWAIDIPESAYQLAASFWPGPLTLILKKAPHVTPLVTGGQDTIGLRAPSHPVAREILQKFQGGLAAPSANRFGKISPTTAQHIIDEFKNEIPLIIDGGPCDVGIESTIIDLSGDIPRILRPGMISSEKLNSILHQSITLSDQTAPRVSGSLESHYAPSTKAVLVDSDLLEDFLNKTNKKIAVMMRQKTSGEKQALLDPAVKPRDDEIIFMPNNPESYAKRLYQTLHNLDQLHFDLIVIEAVPNTPEWNAISDRLRRATKAI